MFRGTGTRSNLPLPSTLSITFPATSLPNEDVLLSTQATSEFRTMASALLFLGASQERILAMKQAGYVDAHRPKVRFAFSRVVDGRSQQLRIAAPELQQSGRRTVCGKPGFLNAMMLLTQMLFRLPI